MKLIVLPKNLTGFARIDGIISPSKEKGEISMTLPLSIGPRSRGYKRYPSPKQSNSTTF